MIDIRLADPGAEDVRPLIEAHLAHSQDAGPDESNHTMGADALRTPDIRFWVLYEGETPLGCGALKALDDGTAEVKSVHVSSAARGRGLARDLMAHLEQDARQSGATALVLETGPSTLMSTERLASSMRRWDTTIVARFLDTKTTPTAPLCGWISNRRAKRFANHPLWRTQTQPLPRLF